MMARVTEHEDAFGRRRYKLGVVEVGIIALGLGVCGWLISAQYRSMLKAQTDMTAQMSVLVTQVAVLNEQIKTLTNQLAGVPANTRAIAKLQAQYAELERRMEVLERKGARP